MRVYQGHIVTCDQYDHVYHYLVEDQGKIIYVGNELPVQYHSHDIIDLKEKALIPSFVDSHIHFASYATFHAGLNVMDARSNEEILNMLKEHIQESQEKIIIGFGASPYSVKEQCLVTRAQLDSVCQDRPIFMVKYDGHTCVINSCLLSRLKDKIKDLRGYHEESGEMNHDAFFEVSQYVTNSISIVQLIKNMQKAIDSLAKQGIGMIHSVSGVGFTKDLDVDLERWFARGLNNGMLMRVFFQTMNVDDVVKRKLPRIGGCFKTALDGCFGSQDAAMIEPYHNTQNKGILYYSLEEVIDFCKKANRAGLQIEMHAIGDRAFQQATYALKAALDDYPRDNHRHTIIHACLPTQEGLAICQQYHILLAMQGAFINWPQEPDCYLEDILGIRSKSLNPLKDYVDHHIILSAGSDGPCTEPDPIQWIHKACNHTNPDQSLSVQEALRMCTYHGYYTSFDEKERGSLEVGKIADMVILSHNPYSIDKAKLNTIQVEQLLLQGKPYQPLTMNPIIHILKGILSKNQ